MIKLAVVAVIKVSQIVVNDPPPIGARTKNFNLSMRVIKVVSTQNALEVIKIDREKFHC